jgi:hypothetical protein
MVDEDASKKVEARKNIKWLFWEDEE